MQFSMLFDRSLLAGGDCELYFTHTNRTLDFNGTISEGDCMKLLPSYNYSILCPICYADPRDIYYEISIPNYIENCSNSGNVLNIQKVQFCILSVHNNLLNYWNFYIELLIHCKLRVTHGSELCGQVKYLGHTWLLWVNNYIIIYKWGQCLHTYICTYNKNHNMNKGIKYLRIISPVYMCLVANWWDFISLIE